MSFVLFRPTAAYSSSIVIPACIVPALPFARTNCSSPAPVGTLLSTRNRNNARTPARRTRIFLIIVPIQQLFQRSRSGYCSPTWIGPEKRDYQNVARSTSDGSGKFVLRAQEQITKAWCQTLPDPSERYFFARRSGLERPILNCSST